MSNVRRTPPGGSVPPQAHDQHRAPDPRAELERAALAKLAGLGHAPANAANDMGALATELLRRTTGRLGTDERFFYAALELACVKGNLPALNRELGKLLEAQDPGLVSKVQDNGQDGYLRFLIGKELGGSEAQRAIDFLESGKDRFSSSALDYLKEGFAQKFDRMADSFRAEPVKTGAILAGGTVAAVGAALAAPAVVAGAGLAYLGYQVIETANAGLDAAKADTAEERAKTLVATGEAAAGVALAAPALAGVRTITGAARAAMATEGGVLATGKTFSTHGSHLGHLTGGAAAAQAQHAGHAGHAGHGGAVGRSAAASGQGLGVASSLSGHALHGHGMAAVGSLGSAAQAGHADHGATAPVAPSTPNAPPAAIDHERHLGPSGHGVHQPAEEPQAPQRPASPAAAASDDHDGHHH